MIIVPYDPHWPHQFEEERLRLLEEIGAYVLSIEHIGSTAVPGLAAKPVIDILIGVRSLQEAPLFIPPLEARGYEYVSQYEDEMPFRRYLHRKVNGEHTHHLHMVEPTTHFYKVQLAFRDYLRTHPETRDAYTTLKINLAEKYHNDRMAYTDAKSDFILGVLEQCGFQKDGEKNDQS
ncbi:MAG: GrpB family protein [Veillonellaceae bacterium]|nr:GrpB family protein [Veillonellaceae bacterium]